MPAAESVALSGLDGVVQVKGGAAPYVPAGDSVWEMGTNAARLAKADDDYAKRTKQTSAVDRAATTYVCVLSRRWGSGEEWAVGKKAQSDGWKDIKCLTADELALWMEDCPGVEAWFREHHGLGSLGDVGIGDWFGRWSRQTDPNTPPALLVAGRRDDVIRVLDAFDDAPSDIPIAAPSVDEAVAFVAAALLLGPGPKSETVHAGVDVIEDADDVNVTTDEIESTDEPSVDPAARQPEKLEALRERTIVIEDEDGWRRWSTHAVPHILVPLFIPASVAHAVDAGHHVVLPQRSRAAQQVGRLASLDPHAATTAWTDAGVDFYRAQDYAFGSRRNLGSLRRRLSPYRQVPTWAESFDASLLASVLLAGGWSESAPGDREVLLALAEHDSWRSLSKALVPLTAIEDAPLSVLEDRWDFVDLIDAWDFLLPMVTADDLTVFADAVDKVLTDVHPDLGLSREDLLKRVFDENRPRRQYSDTLRRGLAATLAILGAVVGRGMVAGNRSGQAVAAIAVRNLLDGADGTRWLTTADVLPQLAEAAPEAFLDAVEASLRLDDPPVMGLFVESETMFGESSSSHSSLLWALETLAYSQALVSRVCVVLARLAVLDPGGRWANRPNVSLASILSLIRPDSAITADNRFDVIDAVVASVPEHATALLKELAEDRGGGIIPSGPRYRPWPVSRAHATRAEWADGVSKVCRRLLGGAPDGLLAATKLISRFSRADVVSGLDTLAARWDDLDDSGHDQVVASLKSTVNDHRRHSSASWAMSPDDLDVIEQFLVDQGVDLDADKAALLFAFTSDYDDRHAELGGHSHEQESANEVARATPVRPLMERRREVVMRLLADGLDSVIEFASTVEVPGYVGKTLAEATTMADEDLLDRLENDSDNSPVGSGLVLGFVAHRATDLNWIRTQIAARPNQAARLLLCSRLDSEVLDIVDTLEPDHRRVYWSNVSPYMTDSATIERVCAGLMEVDRPFSAIVAASVRDEPGPSADLIIAVLSAPMRETQERPDAGAHSFEYIIGRLLNRLEKLGVPDEIVAGLEFFYLPILDLRREPRAAHRELARKPELFAQAVAHCYKSDTEDPTVTNGRADGEESAETVSNTAVTSESARYTDAFFRLLRSWNGPLPGSDGVGLPTAEAVQAWVDQVRVELAKVNRTGVASMVIGEALAAPMTDADGIWPSEPVRTVLEHEQDDNLERHLGIQRFNQGGFTGRSMYAGGDKERKTAKKYFEWARKVSGRWPRAGALLDGLASEYEDDASREDRRAERDARGDA
ncbi:hypothetical protein [Kribbella jiaozuonensis]|uniref:Uncharacterized protein n=1 Tax=Kribbella jiaozuonensis TaxID=2575441 RepID=A0A4U3M315_9ACTN|nr:hypothetical protein [Kribbella jiaozuonensis]TKK81657.1 hypothetical protein FDA38_02125 [Kribbella jiaozuonensis]